MRTCTNCGVLLYIHEDAPFYVGSDLCHDCRLLLDRAEADEPDAYDDIDITQDENNNEHEHD